MRKARLGEKVVVTPGRKQTPVAETEATKPIEKRPFDIFPHPDFDIPADFDDLPQASLIAWSGVRRLRSRKK